MLSEESTSTATVLAPGARRVTSSTGSAMMVRRTAMAAICSRYTVARRNTVNRATRRPNTMPRVSRTTTAPHHSAPKSPANASSPWAYAWRGYLNSHSNHIVRVD